MWVLGVLTAILGLTTFRPSQWKELGNISVINRGRKQRQGGGNDSIEIAQGNFGVI